MKKQKPKKVIYYSDELNDDFAGTNIKTQTVDANFKFIHNGLFWRFFSFLIYYLIVFPLIWIYMKVFLRVKIKNKKALKKLRKQKFYMYGNHTGFIDAFSPNIITFPNRNKIVVGPDTVSIKGLKNFTQMLGALPIPSNVSGLKKFISATQFYHKKYNIVIYPEAHIWPYYTGVRPFLDSSFAYPAKQNSPVVAFFTAYTKPKGLFSCFRKANITLFVSDPIFCDENLSVKENQKMLRDKVYGFMLEKSKFSNFEVIEYIKKDQD